MINIGSKTEILKAVGGSQSHDIKLMFSDRCSSNYCLEIKREKIYEADINKICFCKYIHRNYKRT